MIFKRYSPGCRCCGIISWSSEIEARIGSYTLSVSSLPGVSPQPAVINDAIGTLRTLSGRKVIGFDIDRCNYITFNTTTFAIERTNYLAQSFTSLWGTTTGISTYLASNLGSKSCFIRYNHSWGYGYFYLATTSNSGISVVGVIDSSGTIISTHTVNMELSDGSLQAYPAVISGDNAGNIYVVWGPNTLMYGPGLSGVGIGIAKNAGISAVNSGNYLNPATYWAAVQANMGIATLFIDATDVCVQSKNTLYKVSAGSNNYTSETLPFTKTYGSAGTNATRSPGYYLVDFDLFSDGNNIFFNKDLDVFYRLSYEARLVCPSEAFFNDLEYL